MTRYFRDPASGRHFLLPDGIDIYADLADYEVSQDAAAVHLRGQVGHLVELLDAAARGATGPGRLAELLGEADLPALRGLADDVRATATGGHAAASARIAARGTTIGRQLMRDLEGLTPDDETRRLGRRLDELVARLEEPARAHEQERRREEYRRGARSAIAESLREAGFTPPHEA
ncbi:hypothetical protein, partial [Virgisporangium aliadipatigenens]|uniref:hypothetical protein n=1 Tax=Virgisporangium aliadipatigenens TaxID=741659 RepID=UPI001942ED5C